jgi:CBS domain containing-hemolysin-like protein
MAVLRPAAALLTWIGNTAAKRAKGDDETSVTENDIYDIIEDMAEEGKINEEQGDLISSALQFGDVTVESILTSRVDVAAIDIDMPQEEILAFIKEQNHSRLPVYEGTIDNIIGILHIRRYIRYYIRRGEALDIRPLLYEPFFVHQSTKIDDLLEIMSRKKINLAVVTDNYGGTLGIVTDEDILEELVGEIWDEDDRAVRNVVPMTDGSYSVNPEEHVLDVLDELGISYTEAQEEEIGRKLMNELAYEAFPQIPVAGDSFKYLGIKISVLVMRHNRIMRLKVRSLSEEELQFDRDAAAMAGIDPDTGRFISEDRGAEDKSGEDRNSTANADDVISSDGSAFTEEDARAFAEGKAYQIRQATGKHYSRSMTKANGQERR